MDGYGYTLYLWRLTLLFTADLQIIPSPYAHPTTSLQISVEYVNAQNMTWIGWRWDREEKRKREFPKLVTPLVLISETKGDLITEMNTSIYPRL